MRDLEYVFSVLTLRKRGDSTVARRIYAALYGKTHNAVGNRDVAIGGKRGRKAVICAVVRLLGLRRKDGIEEYRYAALLHKEIGKHDHAEKQNHYGQLHADDGNFEFPLGFTLQIGFFRLFRFRPDNFFRRSRFFCGRRRLFFEFAVRFFYCKLLHVFLRRVFLFFLALCRRRVSYVARVYGNFQHFGINVFFVHFFSPCPFAILNFMRFMCGICHVFRKFSAYFTSAFVDFGARNKNYPYPCIILRKKINIPCFPIKTSKEPIL